jgi:hypothetical protein
VWKGFDGLEEKRVIVAQVKSRRREERTGEKSKVGGEGRGIEG